MNEKRKIVISEINEVAKRIELKFNSYRKKYYRNIPAELLENIFKLLKKATKETEILVLNSKKKDEIDFNEIKNINLKHNTTNVYNYIDSAVNLLLEYYNNDLAEIVVAMINSKKNKLIEHGYVFKQDFALLSNRLSFSNCFSVYTNMYPELLKLQELILSISDIEFLAPDVLNIKMPDNDVLTKLRTLLLELEKKIEVIEYIGIENLACSNVILEYIDCMLEWEWFKNLDKMSL